MNYSRSIHRLAVNRRFVNQAFRAISSAVWNDRCLSTDEVDMWSRAVRVAIESAMFTEADALTRLLEDTHKDAGKLADRRKEAAIKAKDCFYTGLGA